VRRKRGRNGNLILPLEVIKLKAVRELKSYIQRCNTGNKCAAVTAPFPWLNIIMFIYFITNFVVLTLIALWSPHCNWNTCMLEQQYTSICVLARVSVGNCNGSEGNCYFLFGFVFVIQLRQLKVSFVGICGYSEWLLIVLRRNSQLNSYADGSLHDLLIYVFKKCLVHDMRLLWPSNSFEQTLRILIRRRNAKNMSGINRRLRNYQAPPLWSSGQSFWLQIHRSRVRFPALPNFL
jgi:hypothetical protein